MTQDQYEKASTILDELNKLKMAREAIRQRVNQRESQLAYVSPYSCLYEWLHKCAGFFTLDRNKAKLLVHAEAASPVEFEVDEGFIGTVTMYLDAKIEEKEKELSEL